MMMSVVGHVSTSFLLRRVGVERFTFPSTMGCSRDSGDGERGQGRNKNDFFTSSNQGFSNLRGIRLVMVEEMSDCKRHDNKAALTSLVNVKLC